MKANLHILYLLLYISVGLFSFDKKEELPSCELPKKIVDQINHFHFKEKNIDDNFSKTLISNFLRDLDSDGLIFTQKDVDELYKYESLLDNEIKENSCIFLDKVKAIYQKNVLETEKMVHEIFASDLKLNNGETYTFSTDEKVLYAKDMDALKKKWNRLLKYRLLVNYFKMNTDDISDLENLNYEEEIAKMVQETMHSNIICYFNGLMNPSNGMDAYVENIYYTAITNMFDPNSTYFSFSEKETFEGELSSEKKTFGLDLKVNDNNELIIQKIKNYSNARNSALEKGDKIISLKWNNSDDIIDIQCPDAGRIENIIDSNKNQNLNIIVQKKNKEQISVSLTKVLEKTEENRLYSYVLENNLSPKVGYISFSNFYSQSKGNKKSGIAYDFKKELKRLKHNNIDGLIIDLRFNGGGSMREASKIVSLFTNIGPIGITKTKKGEVQIMKDVSVGSYFNKPIVVLVNNYTASASEFLAAALRDHNRAIIVGNRTYGKGTMQVILPIKETDGNDFVKVTVEKFYRINGKSFQKKGISPDISLPMYFQNTAHSESKAPNALVNDVIYKKTYFKKKYNFPMSHLVLLSKRRVHDSNNFKLIEQIIPEYDQYTNQNTYNLNFNKFKNDYRVKLNVYDKINVLKKYTQNSYSPKYSGVKSSRPQSEIVKIEYNIKKLNHDIYIEECYNIMNDFLSYQNKIAAK
ncbi:carboxy terminal-processing peptidase [Aureivirga sp. CE67]|uniref:carboxy terminal-processing peptidase n=1 Tax=Aureivirga sp. CE67 TaxID=1788983 RepID=UPI0018CBE5C2|nr:carboxy terminal-processing peptidase [Aureivirga sp. CE67]